MGTTDEVDDGPRFHSPRRYLAEGVGLVVLAIIVAVVVRTFVLQAYYIPSASMVPQLRVNDRVVVSRLAFDLHRPHRGDIVVFPAPPGEAPLLSRRGLASRLIHDVGAGVGLSTDQTVLIKRVIGLPGETVQGQGGRVYINGRLLIEPYLPKTTATSTFGPERVPPGMAWVMGDNRGNSSDSRVFGAIPEHTIVGRAVWKIWPPQRASFL
ncbi:MAG: signal peptidase I [Actinomycetota bacterium]|nr:signal peptidase I [Actinomycetota bacterium]